MCVAFPGKIIEIKENEALVEIFGVKKRVFLDLLPEEVEIGDYVLSHAGFAIHKVDKKEAKETLEMVKNVISEDL